MYFFINIFQNSFFFNLPILSIVEMVKSALQDLFKDFFASWNSLRYNLKKFGEICDDVLY